MKNHMKIFQFMTLCIKLGLKPLIGAKPLRIILNDVDGFIETIWP